jgi:zinc protease
MALNPVRTRLDNGAVFLVKETNTTPSVAIHLAIRAGSAGDPPGGAGTTWLLSRAIDRGTAARTATAIAEDLDGRGITLMITVTPHLLSLVCRCLAGDFEPVLSLLGEMIVSPSLPTDEIATRKGEVITAIRQDQDNPAVRATEALMGQLYPDGHPYGRPTKGTIEVVERLRREDLVRQHACSFAPAALIGVIVGDVEPPRAHDALANVFASWRKPTAPPSVIPSAPRAPRRQRTVIPMMNKAQADIAYGFTAVTRHDPAYYACWLMNNVFGQYALGGRLGSSIRERQGMAYYVSSSLDASVAAGPLTVRAGVSAANVDRAIASIDEEIVRLVADGVTPKELDESRRYLIGSIPRALETNAGIANFLANEEFFGLGLDYDARLPGYLTSVTLEEVNAVARKVLARDRATIVVAGPYPQPGPEPDAGRA